MKRLDHVGIAVEKLEDAIRFYNDALGLSLDETETIEEMKLKVAKLSSNNTNIELISAMPGETVISNFIAKKGEGIHHICFEVDDINTEMERIKNKGYSLVYEAPKKGAGGALVNFLKPKNTNGVLIELSQKSN